MRTGKALLLVAAAGLVGAAVYGASMVRRGFSARDEPSRLERMAAHAMREMAIPREAKSESNPLAAAETAETLAAAKAHWADHCATCHANDGSGNTEIGRNLYPKAPDMRLPSTQTLTDGELYYIIRNGVRLTGMPAWGNPALARNDESWQLVQLIRHLPKMTAEESEEMKALNPKTDADRAEEKQEEDFLNGGGEPLPASSSEHTHH